QSQQMSPQISPSHNLAYQQQAQQAYDPNIPQSQQVPGFSTWLGRYIDEVVLPGVYKLSEWFEFRWVVGMFVAFFIVFVTALSTIPLMRILKASVEQESQRRALTIARILADQNRTPLSQ